MRQTAAREGVEADRCEFRRHQPRRCYLARDLIHHHGYRTINFVLNRDHRMIKNCYSVIIAGGKGTRFWPLSRAERPKQLLKILGRRSLISETASRVLSISGRKQTLVVTLAEQLSALRNELPDLPQKNFLAEPQGK